MDTKKCRRIVKKLSG